MLSFLSTSTKKKKKKKKRQKKERLPKITGVEDSTAESLKSILNGVRAAFASDKYSPSDLIGFERELSCIADFARYKRVDLDFSKNARDKMLANASELSDIQSYLVDAITAQSYDLLEEMVLHLRHFEETSSLDGKLLLRRHVDIALKSDTAHPQYVIDVGSLLRAHLGVTAAHNLAPLVCGYSRNDHIWFCIDYAMENRNNWIHGPSDVQKDGLLFTVSFKVEDYFQDTDNTHFTTRNDCQKSARQRVLFDDLKKLNKRLSGVEDEDVADWLMALCKCCFQEHGMSTDEKEWILRCHSKNSTPRLLWAHRTLDQSTYF